MPSTQFVLYFLLFYIVGLSFSAKNAYGHSDDKIFATVESTNWTLTPVLTSQEIELRIQAVLRYYKIDPARLPESIVASIKNPRTKVEAQAVLKWMDPVNLFSSLSRISETELSVYSDREAKLNLDFTAQLARQSFAPSKPQGFNGLRIALDPGHMGGEFWDRVTGKFVKDAKGRILSEGVLNLQVCLLLKQRFEALGATVMLTHTGLGPVSTLDYKTFDMKPFIAYEIQESIHADWFQHLIAQAPVGPKLFALFDKSPQIIAMRSERARSDYFSKRADLWARADLINQFNADIVLIIHHDTVTAEAQPASVNPEAPNETKSMVFGSYEKTEFGSTLSRAYFTRHLVDKESWENSVLLSRKVTQRLSKNLGLKLDKTNQMNGRLVEPGVRSRNLMLPRMLTAQNVAYLETLFYNRPEEFTALLQPDFKMVVDGKTLTYSKRLVQIVEAIGLGVEDFVK